MMIVSIEVLFVLFLVLVGLVSFGVWLAIKREQEIRTRMNVFCVRAK